MLTPLRVYCTSDNFDAVEQAVRNNAKKAAFIDK
ncbi:MAG: hypothetical protein A4E28_02802 [Methanocella sp. PtaU1.Bin125]|nr:MAG: hypothetical protein A4E28_02802 [Methanocella sp. PtaU1.Bin125]